MKKLYLVLAVIAGMAYTSVQAESGVEVGAAIGAAVPSGESNTGYSPSIQVSVLKTAGKYVAIGLRAGHDFNYIRDGRKGKEGGKGNGVPGAKAYGTFGFGGGTDVDVDVDQDQSQEQNQSQDNDQNVTVNFPEPKDPPTGIKPTDLAPSSIFYVEPVLRLGVPCGYDDRWMPYITGSFGVSRVTRQDGFSDWGNGYAYGGGVRYTSDSYFIGPEVQSRLTNTAYTDYGSLTYWLNGGLRF